MTIRTLSYELGLETVWEELVYTQARLNADADAAGLGLGLDALITRTITVREGQLKVWQAEIMAQALVDAADFTLDSLVDKMALHMLFAVKQDRKSPRYTRYFGTDMPSGIRRLGLSSQMERMASWPASLKTETEPELKALGTSMEAGFVAGKAALDARVKAAAARADHRARDIMGLVDDVNALRLALYGELIGRASAKGLDKDWPEEFFRREARNPKTPKTTPSPASSEASTPSKG